MPVLDQAFPRLDSQLVNPQNGRVTQPWYRFFISLWTRSGGGTGFDILEISEEAEAALLSDLMGDLPIDLSGIQAYPGDISDLSPQIADPIGTLSLSDNEPSDNAVPAVQSVTVGASPTGFTARVAGFLLISGGTVSAVSLGRGATTTAFPAATALLPLSPGDTGTVTYSVAPTLTFIPR